MTSIAVVGAAGQVGRALMRAFSDRPETRAFGITRNAMSAGPLRADGLDIRIGSLGEPTGGEGLLQGADIVINAALEIDRPKRARARNEALVEGIIARAGAALVVHFSSVAVYGSCVDAGFSTFEHPRPDATYGREKLRLEEFAMRTARRAGQRLLVLRLGHVYGPGQGISRELFDVLKTRVWDLPYDGRLPSNAVHVHHVADAIPKFAAEVRGQITLNATDSPQRTWRALYDMHAEAARYARAGSMTDGDSSRLRDEYRRLARLPLSRRVPRQVSQWARRLPLKSVVNLTAVRQATEAALLALPLRVEQLVDRRYVVFSAAQNLESAEPPPPPGPPPWYYSDGVPGPNLPEAPETAERTAAEIVELRHWHASWAEPVWRTALPRPRA